MTLPGKAVSSSLQAACPYKSDHRPYLIWIDLALYMFGSFRVFVWSTGNTVFSKEAEIIYRFLNHKNYVLFLFEFNEY